MRPFAVLFSIIAIVCCGWAYGATIEILEADRLELRNTTPPGATSPEEYIIISGTRVRLKIDNDELEATRVEINKTKRKLNIIGRGIFRTANETISGIDFSLDMDSEGLIGLDTIIATKQIDVIGISVERLPGQIDVNKGYFSPCGRCSQAINDYAFRAENLTIYPGDRLVATNVTLLISDRPLMFLPVVVIFLNDPNRQPRFQFSDDPIDGKTLEFDLPFFTSTFGIGFTMLRYFEKRDPSYGLGFDYSLFAWNAAKPTRLFFLALPPQLGSDGKPLNTGVLLAYRVETSGQFPLTEDLPPFSFQATISRVDTGILSRELRGISGTNKRTDYDINLGLENSKFSVKLVANGFWDNRDIEALKAAKPNITPQELELGLPTTPLFFPELRASLLGTNVLFGPLSLQSFSFSVGNITAPVDTLNPSAVEIAKNNKSGYITAGRAVESHQLNFALEPWDGASLNASQQFSGKYYTTRNPLNARANDSLGEFERNIDSRISASVEQKFFSSAISLKTSYAFTISEGESPFAFDRAVKRAPSEVLTFTVQLKPLSWLQLTANERFDLRRKQIKWDPATFNLSITPGIVNAGFDFSYDFARNEAISWRLNNAGIKISGFSVTASLSYTYAATVDREKDPRIIPRFDSDLVLGVGYQDPNGRFSVSLTLTDDINIGQIKSWAFSSNLNLGSRENPVNFSLNQTLLLPQYTTLQSIRKEITRTDPITGREIKESVEKYKYSNQGIDPAKVSYKLNGSFSVSALGLRLSLSNNFDFLPFTVAKITDRPPSTFNLSLENLGTSGTTWSIRYSGYLDLDPFAVYDPTYSASLRVPLGFSDLRTSLTYQALRQNPSLSGSLEFSLPTIDLTLTHRFAAPSTEPKENAQKEFELREANLRLGFDVLPGFSIQGSIGYLRTTQTLADKGFVYRDSITYSPFGATLALGNPQTQKSEVFITVLLKGSYTYASESPGKPPLYSNGGQSFFSSLRPIIIFTFDRCCYALQLTFDTTDQRGASFKFAFLLPGGASQSVIEADNQSIRFPAIPFIPPIEPPKQETP